MTVNSIGILFVCLGNICRSPSAQGVLEAMADSAGCGDRLLIDSCGTAAFNVGKPPDPRAVIAAEKRGYDISAQRARQIEPADYERFHYIVAMDRANLTHVQTWAPADFGGEIRLLNSYAPRSASSQVADPYYGSETQFEQTLAILERSIQHLFEHILKAHQLETSAP